MLPSDSLLSQMEKPISWKRDGTTKGGTGKFVSKPQNTSRKAASGWAQEDQLGEGGSAALRKGTSSPTDRALAHDARFTPRQQRSAGEAQRGEMMTLQLKPPHGAKRLKCVNKRKALDKALRLSSKLRCIMWE